jgi:ribonuclease HI
VDWLWVKGHAGNEGNERADALANRGMAEAMGAPSRRSVL